MKSILVNPMNILFLDNLAFLKVKDNLVYAVSRKKIKTSEFSTLMSPDAFIDYLTKNKIDYIKRIGKYFINMNKIIMIDENITSVQTLSKKNNILVRFIFEVDYFDCEMDKDYWDFWKQNNILK